MSQLQSSAGARVSPAMLFSHLKYSIAGCLARTMGPGLPREVLYCAWQGQMAKSGTKDSPEVNLAYTSYFLSPEIG